MLIYFYFFFFLISSAPITDFQYRYATRRLPRRRLSNKYRINNKITAVDRSRRFDETNVSSFLLEFGVPRRRTDGRAPNSITWHLARRTL